MHNNKESYWLVKLRAIDWSDVYTDRIDNVWWEGNSEALNCIDILSSTLDDHGQRKADIDNVKENILVKKDQASCSLVVRVQD